MNSLRNLLACAAATLLVPMHAGASDASEMRVTSTIGAAVETPQGVPLGTIAGVLLDSRRGGVHYALLARQAPDSASGEKLFAYPLNALRRGGGEALLLDALASNLSIAPGYQGRSWPDPQWRDGERYVRAREILGSPVVDPLGNRVGRVVDMVIHLGTGATRHMMVEFADGGTLPLPPHALPLRTDGPLVLDADSSRRS